MQRSEWLPFITLLLVACSSETLGLDASPSTPPDAGAEARPEDGGLGPPEDGGLPLPPPYDSGPRQMGPCYGDPGNAGVAGTLYERTDVLEVPDLISVSEGSFSGAAAMEIGFVSRDGAAYVLSIARPDGQGGFTRLGSVELPRFVEHVAAADFDGDGQDELLVPSRSGLHVYEVSSSGQVTERWVFEDIVGAVSPADLDEDAFMDIVQWDGVARLWVHDGTADTLLQRARVEFPADVVNGAIVDLDADGRVDLLGYATIGPAAGTYLTLQGEQGLQRMAPAVRAVRGLVPADIDGDGLVELVGRGADIDVYEQDGSTPGVFVPAAGVRFAEGAAWLSAIDVDGDAAEDLLSSGLGLAVLRSAPDAPGRFVHLGRLPSSGRIQDVRITDLDADGDEDILLADERGVAIYRRTEVAPPAIDPACLLLSTPPGPPLELETDEGRVYVDDDHPRCGGWAPCFPSIQAAVEATAPRTEIVVRNGVYQEQVVLQSARTLTSSTGAQIRGVEEGACVVVDGPVEATIQGFAITGSRAPSSLIEGFGISVRGDGFDVRIRDNVIRDNGPHGGIRIGFRFVGDSGRALIDGNLIIDNGDGGPTAKGGIYVDGPAGEGTFVHIVNNVIARNDGDAAIWAVADPNAMIVVEHNTVVDNRVAIAGVLGPRAGRLVNNILAGNLERPTGTPSDVFGGPAPVETEFNLIGDPAFTGSSTNLVGVDPQLDSTLDRYRLTPGSPAIDAADPGSVVMIDIDGDPRPQDGDGDGVARADIGADELCVGCP